MTVSSPERMQQSSLHAVKTGIADSASPRRSGRRTAPVRAITPGSACGASFRWLRSFEAHYNHTTLAWAQASTGRTFSISFLTSRATARGAHICLHPLYSHNPMTVGGAAGCSAKVHKVSKPHAQRRSKCKRTTAADPKKNLTGDVNRLTPPPCLLPWTQMPSPTDGARRMLTNAEDTVLEVLCKDLVDPLCALAPMSDKSPGFSPIAIQFSCELRTLPTRNTTESRSNLFH